MTTAGAELGLISRVNDLLLVDPFTSVTVTVSALLRSVPVVVPVMYPVLVSNKSPLAKAGEIANALGVVPPTVDTGRIPGPGKVVPVLITTVAESRVVETAGFTVSAKVLLELALTESVTVTVSIVAVRVSDAVPETIPVAVSKTNPAGNAGVIAYLNGA
jgi:hypothetical protein